MHSRLAKVLPHLAKIGLCGPAVSLAAPAGHGFANANLDGKPDMVAQLAAAHLPKLQRLKLLGLREVRMARIWHGKGFLSAAIVSLLAIVCLASAPTARAQSSNGVYTVWSGSATIPEHCWNGTAWVWDNGTVSGTFVTVLVPNPAFLPSSWNGLQLQTNPADPFGNTYMNSSGTPVPVLTSQLPPTGKPEVPVVAAVNLNVSWNPASSCGAPPIYVFTVNDTGCANYLYEGYVYAVWQSPWFNQCGTAGDGIQPEYYPASFQAFNSSQLSSGNQNYTYNVGLAFSTPWTSSPVTVIRYTILGTESECGSDCSPLGSFTGTPITCDKLKESLRNQLAQTVSTSGAAIQAGVSFPLGLTEQEAATICGFSSFDWLQSITSVPNTKVLELENYQKTVNPPAQCVLLGQNCPLPITGWIDPPPGGYAPAPVEGCAGDVVNSQPGFPEYYFDPTNSQPCTSFNLNTHFIPQNSSSPTGLEWDDAPWVNCPLDTCFPPGQYITFYTQLVGVLPDSNGNPSGQFQNIAGFNWINNYQCWGPNQIFHQPNPLCVGSSSVQNLGSAPPGGTGGSIVTAMNPPTYTLSVSVGGNGTIESVPAGIDCPGTCTAPFPQEGPVTLSATPANGWFFGRWGGACLTQRVTPPPPPPQQPFPPDCQVTMLSNITAGAAFSCCGLPSAPTVAGISPGSGRLAGGTVVSISGTNFGGETAVKFGGTDATAYTIDDPTRITAMAPAGSGTVDVTVTNAGGTSATRAADRFTYSADLTATSTSGQAPLTVTFRADDLPLPMTYTISFGDGTTGALAKGSCIGTSGAGGQGGMQCSGSASHQYTAPGTYAATLSNGSGTALGSVKISVGS